MTTTLIPKRTEQGWLINLTSEITKAMGLPEGAKIMMYAEDGVIKTEILPPLSPELAQIAEEVFQDNLEVFEELKRLGD